MAHNYYFDYKLQYEQNQRNGEPAELSEMSLQGVAYCAATLFTSTVVSQLNNMATEPQVPDKTKNGVQRPRSWKGLNTEVMRVKSLLVRHQFAEAIASSNSLTTADMPHLLDALSGDFADLYFASDFTDELYSAGAAQDDRGAIHALLQVFPAIVKSGPMSRHMFTMLAHANARVIALHNWTAPRTLELAREHPIPAEIRDYCTPGRPFLLTARNPFFLIACGMAYADIAATRLNVPGRLTVGRIASSDVFTESSRFDMPLTKAEIANYVALRRLQRGAKAYLAGFDVYLTYLTDFCRVLERILPPDERREALSQADQFIASRAAIRPHKKVYNRYGVQS